MSIELLYFAAVRESTGKAGEHVELSDLGVAPTVGSLWGWLGERYEAAGRWKSTGPPARFPRMGEPDAAGEHARSLHPRP